MRIGTLTFHWATNYGAIIQAYALQQFLSGRGFETEIVDYVPVRVVAIRLLQRLRQTAFTDFARERKMRSFRRRHLAVSAKRYRSRASLGNAAADYDVLVCGSDQIWNEWFTLNAEGGPTRSYLLDFVPPEKKRISYAASFGVESLSDETTAVAQPELAKFNAISVREESGAAIVESMGLAAKVAVDPTLLLRSDDYERLIGNHKPAETYRFFPYLLHRSQDTARQARDYVATTHFAGEALYERGPISVLDWLFHLKNAEFVVTNSFHGVVFCLIFQRPFVVVAVEGVGHGMNGRFDTLLEAVGMEDRILRDYDAATIDRLYSQEIDWSAVSKALDAMRDSSAMFLTEALGIDGTTGTVAAS